MSGLFGSLTMAARALEAQRFGLDVAGQNIANVNTPGYTRREALLASVPGATPNSPGNGVEIVGTRAYRDERLEQRLRREQPAAEREAALAEALAVVETAIGAPGASIDGAMSKLFDAFGRLASDPTSAVARQEVASQAEALTDAFHDMTSRLLSARRDADAGIRAGVDQVNGLVDRVAMLNDAISRLPQGGAESLHLRDSLGEALKSLSSLVDIDTIARADGGVDVTVGNGRPLVLGGTAYRLESVSVPPTGLASIVSQGVTITAEITGGRLGGLLAARDVAIPAYQDQLDTIAYTIATEVNVRHQAGFDLGGTTGRDFFVPLASAAGAAAAISVDAGILANPSTIAAAATASPGDNRLARDLAALREQRIMPGGTGTLAEGWAALVYRVGADTRAARDEQASRAEIVRQVELLREQVSGVSLDEEAMMMMKFQRAYEANARYFQAIDDALSTLLQSVGR